MLADTSTIQRDKPLIDIQLIEGVFDDKQKQTMISKVTEAMVEIEGEANARGDLGPRARGCKRKLGH